MQLPQDPRATEDSPPGTAKGSMADSPSRRKRRSSLSAAIPLSSSVPCRAAAIPTGAADTAIKAETILTGDPSDPVRI